jgi:hypothetical protein
MKHFILAILALLNLHGIVVRASSLTEPHDHQGIVSPFTPGDPQIPLDKKALAVLASGKSYQTQIQSNTGGRGLVVQDVDAPTDIVWGRILDYDNYTKMVPKTVESKNYLVEDVTSTKKDHLSQIIYTRMKVGFPLLKLEFFIKHMYYPELNSLTWTLDYSKKSDFNDSCGFWYVVPHPDDEYRTRLYYSVEISMFDWVPKFVVDFMSTKALTDATGWVKKYSALEFEKQGGKGATTASVAINTSGGTEKAKKKKKNRLIKKKDGFRWFWQKKSDELEKSKAEGEAKKAAEEATLKATIKAEKEAREKIYVSWTRLGMASAIFVFTLYNIHLGVSS